MTTTPDKIKVFFSRVHGVIFTIADNELEATVEVPEEIIELATHKKNILDRMCEKIHLADKSKKRELYRELGNAEARASAECNKILEKSGTY